MLAVGFPCYGEAPVTYRNERLEINPIDRSAVMLAAGAGGARAGLVVPDEG